MGFSSAFEELKPTRGFFPEIGQAGASRCLLHVVPN